MTVLAEIAADNPRTLSFTDLLQQIDRLRLRGADAIAQYRDWIDAQPAAHPYLFAAWFNLGVELSASGDRRLAAAAYRTALGLRPGFNAAAVNLGLALEALDQPADALKTWEDALQPAAERTALLNHKGRLLEQMGRLEEAEATLHDSLLADPRQPDAVQHWVHIRQKLCRWPILAEGIPGLPRDDLLMQSGPLGILALTDDVAVQREVTERWIARKLPPAASRLSPPGGYRHGRLHIGYLSSDFCSHAMSYLIAEMLEAHDRARFIVHGYCSSPEDGSPVRRRILAAFDTYRPIRGLDDAAAARLIRNDEIDILVDLNGLTAGSRLGILRWKPAPMQATYLGFIGPVPLPELDHLFCDDFVVPPPAAAQYAPAPLPIATLYQVNDRKRDIAAPMTRTEAGLPDNRFVFCCFSNAYKVTAEMFSAWTAILRGAPDSVLWLIGDRPSVRETWCRSAAADGVDPARLIFAERVAPDRYMARLACGDLFLDTFPYNAGTIASDALRMGLPLLTLCGRSFASRMAARLLAAMGAEQGIAHSVADYVAAGVRLATDPAAHASYRARFSRSAWEHSLGDTAGFMAQYEARLLDLQSGVATAAGS